MCSFNNLTNKYWIHFSIGSELGKYILKTKNKKEFKRAMESSHWLPLIPKMMNQLKSPRSTSKHNFSLGREPISMKSMKFLWPSMPIRICYYPHTFLGLKASTICWIINIFCILGSISNRSIFGLLFMNQAINWMKKLLCLNFGRGRFFGL